MRNLFQLQYAHTKDAGGRYPIIIMSLFNDVIIDLVLLNITIQWSNKFASRWESQYKCIID